MCKNNQSQTAKNLVNNDDKSKSPQLSQLESKLDKLENELENKIEMAVKKVLPKAVDSISQTLNENFAKQWSEALFGDYDENFPKLGSKPENDTSDQTQQQTKQQTSKQGILQTVVQKAVTTSKHDDLKREERLNNIIIYCVPESQEKNSDTRKAKEKELVDKLLEKIEVAASPEKIVRLGKYREPKDGEALGSRPLKVTFADHQTQQEVMQNLSKLKYASQELKSLSVCYDMSESEREILKEHMRRAKEKTESSSNWRFVVRGPPWNLEEIRLKKKNITQAIKQNNVKNNISCMLLNADTLTNKMPEFQLLVRHHKPEIICVNEVLPKNFNRQIYPEEFALEGYDMISHSNVANNIGRGTILYVHRSLVYKQIFTNALNSFEESVAVEINLNKNDRLLCAGMYRRGESTDENNKKLIEVFSE